MSLLDNLINLWELDGDGLDQIGDKDLTVTGTTFTEINPNGIIPLSALLDGIDDNLTVSDVGLPDGNSERTFAILFYPTSTGVNFLMDYGDLVSGGRFAVICNLDGSGVLSVSFQGHRIGTAGGTVILDEWNLAMLTVPLGAITTADVTLNYNGVETVLSTTGGAPVVLNTILTGTFYIGSDSVEITFAEMQLSQTAIYNKAMTTEQKDELWNDGNFARIRSLPPLPPGDPTSLFERIYKHLLPNSKALRI